MLRMRIAFGAGLGVLLGLLVDGFLLTHWSGWLAVLIFPVVLPPLVGGVIGGIVGWKLRIYTPTGAVIASMALLCPLAVWAPIKFQEYRFRQFAESLPTYPRTVSRSIQVSPLGFDDRPRVSVEFRSTANLHEMVKYYRDHLHNSGWQPTSTTESAREWQTFQQGNYTIYIIGYDFDRAGEHDKYDCVRITRIYQTFFYR